MGEPSEELLGRVVDACELGVVVLDEEARIVLWNRWMERASGIAAERACGAALRELFPIIPSDARVETAIRSALERGMSSVLSHHLNRTPLPLFALATAPDSSTQARRPIAQMVRVKSIRLRSGVQHCVVEIADVSASVTREAVLLEQAARMQELARENQRSMARTRAILDGAMEGIVTLDREARIETVNPAAEAIFGQHADRLVGEHVGVLIPGGVQLGMRAEGVGRRSHGQEFPAEISVSAMETEAGSMQVLVIRDVTRRIEIERELKDFVRVVSHDLQSPINTIMHFARRELRRGAEVLDERSRECLEQITDASRRMSRLIHDLGGYSRAGHEGRPHRALSLGATVQMATENLEHAIAEVGAQVTVDELPAVFGDQTQLVQIFQNLIGNAIKFTGDARPVVHVTARRERGCVWRISVRDNGIGIDPADHQKVFQIFQRLHREAEYPGSGVGLATCKRIVERHGGQLWLESAPGEGSVFHLTLSEPPDAGAGEREKDDRRGD